jgi:cytochrome c-type biogenesis protein CcmE
MNSKLLGAVFAIYASSVPLPAQQQITDVGQIVRNSGLYRGKSVAVIGMVGTVKPETKVFTLIDSKTARDTSEAASRVLTVAIPEGIKIQLPKPGEEIVVIGQIEGSMKLTANQILTKKGDVERITNPGSAKRKKHPADNLGKDANPSGNISQ